MVLWVHSLVRSQKMPVKWLLIAFHLFCLHWKKLLPLYRNVFGELLGWLPVMVKPSPSIGSTAVGSWGISVLQVPVLSINNTVPFHVGRNAFYHAMSAWASLLRWMWWWNFFILADSVMSRAQNNGRTPAKIRSITLSGRLFLFLFWHYVRSFLYSLNFNYWMLRMRTVKLYH